MPVIGQGARACVVAVLIPRVFAVQMTWFPEKVCLYRVCAYMRCDYIPV